MALPKGYNKGFLPRRTLLGLGLVLCLLISTFASVWVFEHVVVDSNLSAYQANNARALLVANLDRVQGTLRAYLESPDEIRAIELIGWVNATRQQARDMLEAPGANWPVGEQKTLAQLERDLGTFLDETGMNPLVMLENLRDRSKRSQMMKILAGFSAEKSQLLNQMVQINTENLGRVSQDYRQITKVQEIALTAIIFVGLLFAVLLYFIYREVLLADRLRESESELRHSIHEANRANQAKDEFLAASSHELRTPLAAIVGNVDLLKERHPNLQGDATVSAIGSSIQALLYTVNDLLDLSRSGAASLAVHPQPGSVAELALAVGNEFRSACEKAGLRLETQVNDGIAPALMFDPDRLRQILYNLLSNALKFTEHGSITLGAELAPEQPADANVIEFYVADTGIGIERADIARIFEPYVQVDKRRAGSIGTGLGLALTSRLVAAMGAKLQVTSEPGMGSRFYFTLQLPLAATPTGKVATPPCEPLAAVIPPDLGGDDGAAHELPIAATPAGKVAEPPCKPEAAATRAAVGDDDAATPERAAETLPVLLAEDDEGLRDIITGLLDIWGYQVVAVQNGAEAVEAADTRGYGLILTDIQMPNMDGMKLIGRLQAEERTRSIPVIAVTSFAMAGDRERLLEAGFVDYLSKPIDTEAMQQAVTRHLGIERGSDD